MSQRIVLFGGSFDPIHHGHLIVARSIAEQMGVDRVLFVPAAMPPHKAPTHASAAQRLAMLQLAIEGEKLFGICELELGRTGPSYTIETIEQLREEQPHAHLHWVIGADMLEELPQWHRAKDLLEKVDFIVACRPPYTVGMDEIFARLEKRFSPLDINGLRRAIVATPLLEISSTDIRQRVASGLSISYLVPPAVARYIRQHGLYKGSKEVE